MTPPDDDEAARLLEDHLATLDQHKGQLERALAHLRGSAGEGGQNQGGRGPRGQGPRGSGRKAQTAGPGGGRRPQGGKTGSQRAPRGARRGEVIADLKANPASTAADVAQRIGINPTHAQSILANLVKQGVASKEGRQFTVVSD